MISADAFQVPEMRDWKNQEGKVLTATLVAADEDSVTIRRKDNLIFKVKLVLLSEADRSYVERWKKIFEEWETFVFLREIKGNYVIISADKIPVPDFKGAPASVTAAQKGRVRFGDIIQVAENEHLECTTNHGSKIRLEPGCEIRFPKTEGRTATYELELLKGKLFLNIDSVKLREERKNFILKAPTAVLAVKGTTFFADLGEDGFLSAGVIEGEIKFSWLPKRKMVAAGGFIEQVYHEGSDKRRNSKELMTRPLDAIEKRELNSFVESTKVH
ncbi:MAG: FecR domain-containing protein [Verrucomicrobiales bacterium]|nr:FecR domain-containing protein [Verrucomicrobiales bacterium]